MRDDDDDENDVINACQNETPECISNARQRIAIAGDLSCSCRQCVKSTNERTFVLSKYLI